MIVSCRDRSLVGEVKLPGSKSESNRALMMAAYGGFQPRFENLSEANDTKVLQRLLRQVEKREDFELDCEDAGSAARFLLTFLSCREGEWLLTGTERLCQRPMADLVDALRELGAMLTCLGQEGRLPIRVLGRKLDGGVANVKVDSSSQFASSLLLAAPVWKKGLTLCLEGEAASLPYIDMTLAMMRRLGAEACRKGAVVQVAPRPYCCGGESVAIASDWSSASYWFEAAALSETCDLLLRDLSSDSMQGDKIIVDMMRPLGVVAAEEPCGVRLRKAERVQKELVFDFFQVPDLLPAVMGACAGLSQKARFTGVRNLVLKESDRLSAMAVELAKTGAVSRRVSRDEIILESFEMPNDALDDAMPRFAAHDDHRIAMALAPMALVFRDVEIIGTESVGKSYPDFWKEFEKIVG